jgi:acylphosphatase
MPERGRARGAGGRVTVRVTLRGRVQGVGFRAWTVSLARGLGLDGWVRNRADGSVEAVFSGAGEAVSRALERMDVGPPGARVTGCEVRDERATPPSGFVQQPSL